MNTSTLLLLMTGCVNTVRFPPDLWGGQTWTTWRDSGFDTGQWNAPNGEVQVNRVFGGCDAESTAFEFSAITTGWANGATFSMYRESDARLEHHDMTIVDLDPNGAWDRWRVWLEDGAEPKSYIPGISTMVDCEEPGNVSFAIRLHGPSERTTDCVIWGQGRNALNVQLVSIDPDVSAMGGCELIDIP